MAASQPSKLPSAPTKTVKSADTDKVVFRLEILWLKKASIKKSHKLLTIIFVHGLQVREGMDAWKNTWTRRGTNMCWPQAWLPEDLGEEKVRVLSASYDFAASHWGKKGQKMQEVQKFGSSLLEQLIHKDGAWLDDSDKVVLVGHSFGGLVIKSLFVEASKHNDDKCNEFLQRTKGTIFYSVPHSGDLIARYIENFNKAFFQRLAGTLSNLSAFETEMKELSKDFEDKIETLSKKLHRGIKIFSFAEQLDYNKVSSRIYV